MTEANILFSFLAFTYSTKLFSSKFFSKFILG
jgi:hypothetical protein